MMTPDGRTVTVPDDMIGQFRGLTPMPAQPPVLPSAPVVATPMPPPPKPAAATPMSAPVDAPVARPAQVPVPDAGPPPAAPKPITQREIATMGEAGPLNAEVDALTGAKVAAERLGQAIGDQAMAIGAVETAANDEADRQLAEIQRTSEANAKAVQDATDGYIRNSKRVADIKVDHGVDHPLVAAIGTALNILGAAMAKGDMTKVMDPIYRAVKAKVDAQMLDIENGRAGLALQREALGLLKQNGNDRVALQNTFMLSGLEQAKRRVQEMKDKSTSAITKAQADQAMTDLDSKIAGTIGSAQSRYQQRQDAAAARAQAERLARAQNAVTMRGQDLQHEEHTDTIAAQIMLAKNEASASAAAKGQAKAAEDIQKRSLGGEVSVEKDDKGNIIYNDDGTPKTSIGLMKTAKGDIWIPGGTDANVSKLQENHDAAVKLVRNIDEIRRLGPEWLSDTANSDKRAKLIQLFNNVELIVKDYKHLGVIAGPDLGLMHGYIGTNDPTRFKDSMAGLTASRDSVVRDHNDELQTAHYDGRWNPPDLAKIPKAPIDEVRTLLKAKPDANYDKAYGQALIRYYPKGKVSDAEHREAVTKASEEAKSYAEISPKQRRAIEKLTEQGMVGDRKAVSALIDIASGEGVASDTVKRLAAEAKSLIDSDMAERKAKTGKYTVTSDAGPINLGYNPETLGKRFQAPPSKPTIEP